jgi:hypothetical protein
MVVDKATGKEVTFLRAVTTPAIGLIPVECRYDAATDMVAPHVGHRIVEIKQVSI